MLKELEVSADTLTRTGKICSKETTCEALCNSYTKAVTNNSKKKKKNPSLEYGLKKKKKKRNLIIHKQRSKPIPILM